MDPPECPVCLQPFSPDATVPRVLSCGHSACDDCLAHIASLPSASSSSFPDTIRCPACTQLVRFPRHLGPAALPKNIDLLRLLPPGATPSAAATRPSPAAPKAEFLALPWSRELLSEWREWVLPFDAIDVGTIGADGSVGVVESATARNCDPSCVFRRGGLNFQGNENVRLCPISRSSTSTTSMGGGGEFSLSYMGRVMKQLNSMSEKVREELSLILRAVSRQRRGFCRIHALWMNAEREDSPLYLVCEMSSLSLHDFLIERGKKGAFGEDDEDVLGLGLIGMELCEAVMGLHSQGVVCGYLDASCFCFDGYGHCVLDLTKVLTARRRFQKVTASSRKGDGPISIKPDAFISPEAFELVHGRKSSSTSGDNASYGSDVWSLACVLAMLFLDVSSFDELLFDNCVGSSVDQYKFWMAKVNRALEASLMKTHCEPLLQIMKSCLRWDSENRPPVSDLWKCLRNWLIKSLIDLVPMDLPAAKEPYVSCLLLSDLSVVSEPGENVTLKQNGDIFKETDTGSESSSVSALLESNGSFGPPIQNDQLGGELINGLNIDMRDGLREGGLKSVTLQGHRDCISGLAIGGGFLFSSSFDKTVHVWSLKDFSLVQSFRGHEHRVMAVLALESTQTLCVSGDSGGFIFVWTVGNPAEQGPLRQWREHNDWRYSGVHSLAALGSQYLYTGSGDKSIKAWSLQDYSLACTMTGHASTVSTIVVSNGILYSGSWDGTVRLWWLDDHSPLAVLGNDPPGNGFSVLSLSVDGHLISASYENGHVKMWRNDTLVRSEKNHSGAIFALQMNAKWLFTGGWDKIIKVQELSEDGFQVDLRDVGSIICTSVVTSLLYWQGKLFVGFSNKDIEVYHHKP